MTEATADLFEQGLKRYQDGEDPETLIPVFKDICDRSSKNATGWACLAWLYLLVDKPKTALKMAQKSVKIDQAAPQARVNLVLAMLETDTKGIRPHIETVQQMIALDKEVEKAITENIEDGFSRKPQWKSLQKVQNYLFSE
ncbi:MAG: tetratricopeptide repeat protein [Microcystaceae cyanobacterium]